MWLLVELQPKVLLEVQVIQPPWQLMEIHLVQQALVLNPLEMTAGGLWNSINPTPLSLSLYSTLLILQIVSSSNIVDKATYKKKRKIKISQLLLYKRAREFM